MTLRECAALLALAAMWGASFLFIRVAAPAFGPLPLMAARVLLAAAVLGVVHRLRGGPPLLLRQRARPLLVLGAVHGALPFTLFAAAELYVPASLAATLNATVPLFSAGIGAAWLGERVGARRALGLALGVVGVAMLVGWTPIPRTTATALSVAAVLVASACYAAGGAYTKRRLSDVPGPVLALGQQLGAAAWLVGPALATLPGGPIPAPAVWALVGLAVPSTAAAYLLFFYLIGRLGPTRTFTVTYLIPFFGLLWGAVLLGEPVTRGMLAGLATVVASVGLVNGVRLPRMLARGPAVAQP